MKEQRNLNEATKLVIKIGQAMLKKKEKRENVIVEYIKTRFENGSDRGEKIGNVRDLDGKIKRWNWL